MRLIKAIIYAIYYVKLNYYKDTNSNVEIV